MQEKEINSLSETGKKCILIVDDSYFIRERLVAMCSEVDNVGIILQAAMDCSPSGIAIADAPSGKLRYVNKAGLMIPAKSEWKIVKDIDINKYVSSWHIKHHNGTPYKPDEVPLARAVMYGWKRNGGTE